MLCERIYIYLADRIRGWKPNYDRITHAYGHRLADVHLAGFAPAFTLSFHDSEYARKPPVPIASVVSNKAKIKTSYYKLDREN
jgi:hypothetical protein